MKVLLKCTAIFIACLILTACESNQKQKDEDLKKIAIQLEDESIASGARIDTMNRGYSFGMTKDQVYKQSLKLRSDTIVGIYSDSTVYYRFKTKNFILWNLVEFYYYEGKLWRTVESVMQEKNEPQNKANADYIAEVLEDTKKNFGDHPYTNGTRGSKFYWLRKNARIDYFERTTSDSVKKVFVAYTDIPVERVISKENDRLQQLYEIKRQNYLDSVARASEREEKLITEKLKVKAKRDWPNDYVTQEYWINKQIEAYKYMKSIPEDKIKLRAQRDWPLDFVTQMFWYNKQIEAKDRLEN